MSWLSSLKSVFSPAQEVKEEEIQTVLQNYLLPDSKDALKEQATVSVISKDATVKDADYYAKFVEIF